MQEAGITLLLSCELGHSLLLSVFELLKRVQISIKLVIFALFGRFDVFMLTSDLAQLVLEVDLKLHLHLF